MQYFKNMCKWPTGISFGHLPRSVWLLSFVLTKVSERWLHKRYIIRVKLSAWELQFLSEKDTVGISAKDDKGCFWLLPQSGKSERDSVEKNFQVLFVGECNRIHNRQVYDYFRIMACFTEHHHFLLSLIQPITNCRQLFKNSRDKMHLEMLT